MSTKIVRLSTGEELLCKVEKKVDGTLTLSKVGILIPKQSNELGIAPFMAYSKNESFNIEMKDVMFMVEPVENLEKQHDTMFSPIIRLS